MQKTKIRSQNKEEKDMNPLMWILVIIGGLAGVGTTLYILISFVAVVAFKIYRMKKYHLSFFD